jgi:DNA invertase Pin-like site-specific DNA recombinase
MFTLLAEFARLERETLRERILSGTEEVRRQGKHLGRPDGSHENKDTFLKKYPSVVRNLRQ